MCLQAHAIRAILSCEHSPERREILRIWRFEFTKNSKKNLINGTSLSLSLKNSKISNIVKYSISIFYHHKTYQQQKKQSRRYDSRTTTFSPEGRLFQVEYAMEAINNAASALGLLCSDGIVLAVEKRVQSKLLIFLK